MIRFVVDVVLLPVRLFTALVRLVTFPLRLLSGPRSVRKVLRRPVRALTTFGLGMAAMAALHRLQGGGAGRPGAR
jgi:hypothetical protein